MVQDTDIFEHAARLGQRAAIFALNTLPYVGLVLLGHTATSLDHHATDWRWSVYLVSCTSTVVLGIAIYCLVEALSIPTPWGYALAVLAGRNTRDTLDVFSRDILDWVRGRMKP